MNAAAIPTPSDTAQSQSSRGSPESTRSTIRAFARAGSRLGDTER